jgi:hypothetical protein
MAAPAPEQLRSGSLLDALTLHETLRRVRHLAERAKANRAWSGCILCR